MLGARMMATGEMNVERLIEFQTLFEILRNLFRMELRIRRREPAAGVSRASNAPRADIGDGSCQAEIFDRFLDRGQIRRANIGDEQVLPDGQADCAAAVTLGNVRQAAELIAL